MRQVTKKDALARVDSVLAKADEVIANHGRFTWVNPEAAQVFRAAGLSLLGDFYGTGHAHYRDFYLHVTSTTADGYMQGRGIIRVMREEVEGDLLATTQSIIAAGVFTDFIEMAEHLHEEGYTLAAAVIAGGALEAHLKRLATANGIELTFVDAKQKVRHKSADAINTELRAKDVYDKPTWKQVEFWQSVRNRATHENIEPKKEDLDSMLRDVRVFLDNYPA